MDEDPDEAARRAFGDAALPPASSVAPAGPGPHDGLALPLAEYGTRVWAWFLDQLFMAGISVAGILAIGVFAGTDTRTVETLAYAVALPVTFLYAPLLMARSGPRNGQTWGKQIADIRVVRVDGAQVGFWTGVLRTAIGQQLLTAITFYLYAFADYLWPLRDARRQALHDKIAKTLVVGAMRAAAPVEPAPGWEQPVRGAWLPPQAPGA